MTRSRIRSRSNSAIADRTWNSSRPAGVVVSTACDEIDAQCLELLPQRYEVVDAPGEAVEFHADHHVDFVGPGGGEERVERMAALLDSSEAGNTHRRGAEGAFAAPPRPLSAGSGAEQQRPGRKPGAPSQVAPTLSGPEPLGSSRSSSVETAPPGRREPSPGRAGLEPDAGCRVLPRARRGGHSSHYVAAPCTVTTRKYAPRLAGIGSNPLPSTT